MHSQAMLLKMFDFNHRINTRLLGLAANLSPAQWTAPQPIGRQTSLHETLFHILTVEEEWFYFCEQGTPRWGFRQLEDLPDVASLQVYTEQHYKGQCAYLEGLDEAHLTAMVEGQLTDGQVHRLAVWYMLTHVLFHSAQHRSEAAIILTGFGHSPSFIDFMGYDW